MPVLLCTNVPLNYFHPFHNIWSRVCQYYFISMYLTTLIVSTISGGFTNYLHHMGIYTKLKVLSRAEVKVQYLLSVFVEYIYIVVLLLSYCIGLLVGHLVFLCASYCRICTEAIIHSLTHRGIACGLKYMRYTLFFFIKTRKVGLRLAVLKFLPFLSLKCS